MKIRHVGSELFNEEIGADRHDESNSHFKKTLRTCPKNSRRLLIRSGSSAWLLDGGTKHA